MSCCTLNHIHPGKGCGHFQNVNGIEIYITYPRTSPAANDEATAISPTQSVQDAAQPWDRAIILLSEGHGIKLPNIQVLADALAKELACPVFAPDLLCGLEYPLIKPAGWDGDKALAEFLERHHPGTVDPILNAVLDWMRKPVRDGGFGGVRALGGVGYCFGGRYVMRLLATGDVDVGVVNHPSFFTMDEVRRLGRRHADDTVTTPCMSVWKPLAVFAAEEDDIFPEQKRRVTEDELKLGRVTWMCQTFAHTEHGFSVRGDESQLVVKYAKEAALKGAVDWFRAFL